MVPKFVKVFPHEYKRVLAQAKLAEDNETSSVEFDVAANETGAPVHEGAR
jgi:hypothetical protein